MLRIENLSVAVAGRKILDKIDLHIAPGEVHVLFGPNGTGKSTLIGAVMGFERYQVLEGRIWFKGQDITSLPCYERAKLGVGMMIQRPPTIRGLSLRKMTELCGATPEETEHLAEFLDMTAFLDRNVNEGFSGGELKRAELLQLLAQKPELLLLDEPESGVDIENIALVGRAANRIIQGKGHGALIITHLGHILQYVPATHAHILYQGRITCQQDAPLEVLRCIEDSGYSACVAGSGCHSADKCSACGKCGLKETK